MTYDSAAWGALAFALSTLLGVVTFFRWRSRGLAAGVRGTAWTILPVAAWLTGVLELVVEVADSVGDWALHLVFSPVVWLGIVLAGISAVLFGVSGFLAGRGTSAAPVESPKRTRGSLGAGSAPGSAPAAGPVDDDLADIEAILRKHGIS